MRAGNLHVFAVLGDGAASYLNALGLQNAGDLFIGEGFAWVFIFDKLFYAALQD
jgi:hypothetical protein